MKKIAFVLLIICFCVTGCGSEPEKKVDETPTLAESNTYIDIEYYSTVVQTINLAMVNPGAYESMSKSVGYIELSPSGIKCTDISNEFYDEMVNINPDIASFKTAGTYKIKIDKCNVIQEVKP